MRRVGLHLVAFVTAIACATCLSREGYECEDDDQCNLDGRSGECRSGYCAYADDDCPTGLRWEDDAPTVGGRCVPPDGESGSTGGSGDGMSSGSGTGSGTGAGSGAEKRGPLAGTRF